MKADLIWVSPYQLSWYKFLNYGSEEQIIIRTSICVMEVDGN